jgi:arylsulfatase A-like enzyme
MKWRRNLVIVLGHGLRSDALSDSQAWPLQTPNLLGLAGKGVRLIATSACPADPGGMVSLLTALHARQHGYALQDTGPTQCAGWAASLADAGYHVAGVGCVGLIRESLAESVEVADVGQLAPDQCAYLQAMQRKGVAEVVIQQRRQRLRAGPFDPERLKLSAEDDVDGFIAQRAERMLGLMPPDRPWVLIVSFSGPANDLPPPAPHDRLFDPQTLELGFLPADQKQIDALAELDYPRVRLQRLVPKMIGRIRNDYLGRVSLFDESVGGLVAAAAGRPDGDRTWFVVASDRGCLLGEHGLVGHRSFLAAALETPAIFAPPTSIAASKPNDLISTTDVAATIAQLGGADLPAAVTGRSLLPLLAGEPLTLRIPGEGVLCEYGQRLLLESERHKVIFNTDTRSAIGLYDLLADPDEKVNLVDTAAGINLLDAMRLRLGDALLSLRAPGGA